ENRDDIMIAADGHGFDLILANALASHTYQRRGWLAPVTAAEVPNLRHIDPQWLEHEAGVRGYGVPYFWGTLGIAYREDLVEAPVTSWMQLYKPTPDLQGGIVMIKHSRDLIGMALMALGYSANSGDAAELAAARQLLLEQRPHVKKYGYIALTEESALVSGEVVAAQVYSGDGLMLRELEPHIRYVVPEEGTNIWIDYWQLAADSDNRKLAFEFLNFINEPENAARLADYLQYPTPNRAAEKLMSAEYREDPLINPGADVLDRGEFYALLAPREMRKWNALFAEIVN
ncbi:MAG: spermidine/putrescine ABC transporter substrate-binding protein, partial [Thiogranum sp.]|nr:spermidine/putrescine ABC transporter substrate-binding protein [Thiogranum sp.]